MITEENETVSVTLDETVSTAAESILNTLVTAEETRAPAAMATVLVTAMAALYHGCGFGCGIEEFAEACKKNIIEAASGLGVVRRSPDAPRTVN